MKIRHFIACLAAVGISTAASGQMTIDLDPAPGDQGKREAEIKPGQTFAVELIALGGAKGMIGFKAELKFDKKQLNFKGFNGGGLMAGAMSMPPKPDPTGVEINAAIMGGGGAASDAGPLGQLLFEAGPDFKGTPIDLVSASFGSTAGIQSVGARDGMLKVYNPDAPRPPEGQRPPENQRPPQGQQPQGQGGFQNPPGNQPPQGHGQGQSGFQNPPGNRPPQGQGGFQNPPGNRPPQGHGQGQSGFQNPPGGHPGQMGGGQHGGPMGPGGEPMDPEQMIERLPEGLRASFRQTMDVERESERAHLEAELKMARSVRGTLEKTKVFLENASPEDSETVAKVLMYFHMQDDGGHDPMRGPGSHGGPPPPGMGHQGMSGGPGGGMPQDAKGMIRSMIQEVEQEIQQLEQELQNL